MVKPSDILGMNARNSIYVATNSNKAKKLCASKFETKKILEQNNIPHPRLIKILHNTNEIEEFDWDKLTKNFVIKPTNGHAGKGVIPFKKKISKDKWIDTMGKVWTLDDIKLHCRDIVEGLYSTHNSQPSEIILEQRVIAHPKLMKYSYRGTPDIRVIVYNSIPVMSYLRLPTKESEGRANQSQGAIGVGIDIATGITTYATLHKTKLIKYLPGTKKKLNGIKIPHWDKLLLTAVKASNAIGLSYSGVDLFIDKEEGPLVVELNAYPGLSIQIANQAGLRKRLRKVEDIYVRNAKHGVKIGQALFSSTFTSKIKDIDSDLFEEKTKISLKEEITIKLKNRANVKTLALVKTSRFRSAISYKLANELGLYNIDDLLWFQSVKKEGKLPVVEVTFKLKNKTIKTGMLVSKRLDKTKHKVELGRRDLIGFIIDLG